MAETNNKPVTRGELAWALTILLAVAGLLIPWLTGSSREDRQDGREFGKLLAVVEAMTTTFERETERSDRTYESMDRRINALADRVTALEKERRP